MTDDPFDAGGTHRRFVRLAEEFSPSLAADMRAIGPVDFPERRGGGLGTYLARAVVGQQLSTHVARAIWGRVEARARDAGETVPSFVRPANAEILRACDMAAIFYFRDPDIWPEGDLAVQKTFARYLGRRNPLRAAARFAPQRSVLALTMWEIVHRMP